MTPPGRRLGLRAYAALPLIALLVSTSTLSAADADGRDWPFWRGPESNGVSRETGLIDDWDPGGGPGSHVAWVRDDMGGRGTPIVSRGKLYTIVRADPGTPREGEKVVCLDAKTGQTIWENRFNVYLSDVPDTRVGWSSCVSDPETGRIFALGVCGLFQCLDGETGRTIWSHPLHERFGLLSTYGGRTNFPVVFEDLVIISAVVIGWGETARPTHRFLAFDKDSGEAVWHRGTRPLPYDTSYSAPTVTVLDGQAALVFGSGDGQVWAFQPRTGLPIWRFSLSRRALNIAPLVVGDTVFMSHSEENIDGATMGTVVAIDGKGKGDITQSGQLWRVDELMVGKSSPLTIDGRLVVCDDRAKLRVLDADTGETIGRRVALGTVMRSSPLYADGKIYAFTANGRWYILQLEKQRGAQILKKGRLPATDEVHASPICANGRIYVQTTGRLYCLHDPTKQQGSTPRPAAPAERSAKDDANPATVQVVPADVLMRPGQTQPLKVRLYNDRGQFLNETEASFTLDGPGSISAEGIFSAPSGKDHVATIVHAKVGDLEGVSRIRTIPPLPWSFDFEDAAINPATSIGNPPVTWMGAKFRHVIREMDGSQVMVKVTTIPKGTRSRCWFGHSDLHDYTIQADVRGASRDGKLPDIGLIAQGYVLDLMGESQQLQIRSWYPQLRMAQTVSFPWKPDQWYTMKLQASVRDGKAVLRGKVWPRDQDEPDPWTLEAVDPSPNTTGSPGLFGNAKDAEIYLDNLKVYEN